MWDTLRNLSKGMRLRSEASTALVEIDRALRNRAGLLHLVAEPSKRTGSIDLGFGRPRFEQSWHCGGKSRITFTAIAEEWYGDNVLLLSYDSQYQPWPKSPTARFVTRTPTSDLNNHPVWRGSGSEGFVDFIDRFLNTVARDFPDARRPKLPG